ncbi:iron-sulfur cluster repair protein YtfE [Pseudokordiimonas caeni]|uniref:iron-sulfur cluster repair protein YtfE n=1 Tax=Pseudokordiimonas caeni TaxID=2997908 RepID=UPI0028118F48|nr:iron-sulfur cluster repair protein YtfE [Pseudokordiimonas caeni]
MTLLDQSLGTLAQEIPGATAVFNRHGLSFCCGGSHTLLEAATKAGIDHAALVNELTELQHSDEEASAWESAPTTDLIQHILGRYHLVHRAQLKELVRLADRVEQVHGDKPGAPNGLADHLRLMTVELESHMQKEEQVLFPLLTSGQAEMAAWPIRAMMAEHEDHAGALDVIDRLTNGLTPPDGACNTWRALYSGLATFKADLEAHIALENSVLFARALGNA